MKYSGYLNWKFENVFKMAEERRGRCFTFCSGHFYKMEYIGGFKRGRVSKRRFREKRGWKKKY